MRNFKYDNKEHKQMFIDELVGEIEQAREEIIDETLLLRKLKAQLKILKQCYKLKEKLFSTNGVLEKEWTNILDNKLEIKYSIKTIAEFKSDIKYAKAELKKVRATKIK